MNEYIAITKQEKRMILFLIIFYMILSLALCFKGMKLMAEYRALEEEKEALEELVEVQKGMLEV